MLEMNTRWNVIRRKSDSIRRITILAYLMICTTKPLTRQHARALKRRTK